VNLNLKKHQITSTKLQIISKFQYLKFQTLDLAVWVIEKLVIVICLLFVIWCLLFGA